MSKKRFGAKIKQRNESRYVMLRVPLPPWVDEGQLVMKHELSGAEWTFDIDDDRVSLRGVFTGYPWVRIGAVLFGR